MTRNDSSGTAAVRAARRGPHLQYRPGLDGLRALAVAAVFLYHARGGWLPGGFLGVDVFFALSGYLITSLLLVEWERARQLDLARFWGRRARRLLPAVVVVVAASLVAAATVGRDVLARTQGDAISSLLYVTNWHLIAASHSYFNAFGRPSPLQHLWSLAVEEQFYLLWPPLLVVGLALLGRRLTIVLTLAAAAGSATLMWMLYDPERDPSRVYYGTDTRAVTLLVGALLAFAWPAARFSARRSAPRAVALLDVVGVGALGFVVLLFLRLQDYDPRVYRGGIALVAVAASLVVAAAAHPASRLGRALGCAPLRWLGVRSYGIYLWHWPVLVFSRPGIDVPWRGAWLVAAQAAVTVALAALSYRFVEEPIRRGGALRGLIARVRARPRRGRLVPLATATILLGAGLALVLGMAAPSRSPHAVVAPAVGPVPIPVQEPPPVAHHRKPHVSRAKPGPVLAVGDSVMLGCSRSLEQQVGRGLRLDAVVGRQTIDTIDRLAQYRAHGALPATVVVQVGDNGPAWYADLVRLRQVLGGVRHVILVSVRVDRSWQGEVNGELAQFAPTWRHATVADWYAHSSDGMLQDGVHPTPSGCSAYARTVADALRRAGG